MQEGMSLISWGPRSFLFRNYNFSPKEWKLPAPPKDVYEGSLNCEFELEGVVRYTVRVSRGDTATVGGMCECELEWGDDKSNAGNDREKTTSDGGSLPIEEPNRGRSFERRETKEGEPLEWSGRCQQGNGEKCNVGRGNINVGKAVEEDSQPTEAEIMYYWRTHANASESARFRAMLDAGRNEQVIKEVSALRASVLATQEEVINSIPGSSESVRHSFESLFFHFSKKEYHIIYRVINEPHGPYLSTYMKHIETLHVCSLKQ